MPIILSAIMLSLVMLNVVAPLVIILIVVAPFRHLFENGFENLTIRDLKILYLPGIGVNRDQDLKILRSKI